MSADYVFFYVHRQRLTRASQNSFGSTIPVEVVARGDTIPVVFLPESSGLLNVALHTIYDMSCAPFHPSLDSLISTIDIMRKYEIPVRNYIKTSTPLFAHILSLAPLRPMDVYAAAAANDLDDLATATSSYLLWIDLSTISDAVAKAIGPTYLKRLFLLHQNRLKGLKELLLDPPKHHGPSLRCSFQERVALTRAWVLASSSLVWEGRPGARELVSRRIECDAVITDISTGIIQDTLGSLALSLSCEQCKDALNERIREVIRLWVLTKVCPRIA